MTTDETEALAKASLEQPPDTAEFDLHRTELAAMRSKAARVRYAASVLGPDVTPVQVGEWLAAYGHTVAKSTLYENTAPPTAKEPESVSDARRSVTDTSDLPKLTPEELASLDALTGVPSGVRTAGIETVIPVEAPRIPEPEPAPDAGPMSGSPDSGIAEPEQSGPEVRTPEFRIPDSETVPDRIPDVDTDNTRTLDAGPDMTENRFRVGPDFRSPESGTEAGSPEPGVETLDSRQPVLSDSGSGADHGRPVVQLSVAHRLHHPNPESGTGPEWFEAPVPSPSRAVEDQLSADYVELQAARRHKHWAPIPDTSGSVVRTPEPQSPDFAELPDDSPTEAGPAMVAKSRPWTKGLYVSAVMCMLMSLNTSWYFVGEHLHITAVWERVSLFVVLETFLISCAAAMAGSVRQNMEPGPAVRLAVWGGAGLGVWMALGLELGQDQPDMWAAVTRLVAGPVGAVVALHLALGLEKRERRTKAGTLARVGRELRERLLSRLGLADDERDAAQRTRDRAATRAVALSQPGWTPFRTMRLQRALLAAGVADDPQLRERLLERRRVAHSAQEFIELEQGSAWTD